MLGVLPECPDLTDQLPDALSALLQEPAVGQNILLVAPQPCLEIPPGLPLPETQQPQLQLLDQVVHLPQHAPMLLGLLHRTLQQEQLPPPPLPLLLGIGFFFLSTRVCHARGREVTLQQTLRGGGIE